MYLRKTKNRKNFQIQFNKLLHPHIFKKHGSPLHILFHVIGFPQDRTEIDKPDLIVRILPTKHDLELSRNEFSSS